ncbi:membrane-associated guanylate kinase [Huso huso]|uniref:Membrane-associated guanylate kinase, WW and PDZ domain-containing protein 3 n=1 Tax=Huso huso TaxID=61971 RepID=A0ABR0YD85_HUSHU
MSKTLKKKKHWSNKVQECALSWGNGGEFSSVVEIHGGAERGEFPYLGQIKEDAVMCHSGKPPTPGDVLLEVNGTPVSGLTNRDTLAVIRHFREPIRLKTVRPGKVLNSDLRHYLSLQFQKGSLDHKLQQVIRDNLYLRTIPCTTRQPRDGEVPGVDYNFISVGEFRTLEDSGALLESGTYDGNYYGTPKPPAEPSPIQPDLVDQVLFDEEFGSEVQRKRTTSVSKMERNDSTAPEEEEDEDKAMVNGVLEDKDSSEWRKTVPSYTQSNSSMDFRFWNSLPRDENQEPLPKNWEMAYTESGMVYFIDHNTKTTTWLDPHLAKKAKPPEKCDDGELPYGWEKIEDPQYGTYYVDHINQKTQFENPVLEAKKKLTQEGLDKPQQAAAPPTDAERPPFTRDPSQLQGTMVRTALRKSNLGFGFTIIGGDRSDEFLQVKNVLKDGPAAQDTKIASGDVIVDINGTCVLGKTHADVVQMFQSVAVNQYVDMVLCRGYPLPEDTGSEPSSDIVTATPLINGQPMLTKGEPMHGSQELQFILSDQNGRPVIKALPNGRFNGPLAEHPENRSSMASTGLLQPELVTVPLVKGPNGFGFAIADSPLGQKVKMILDGQWCSGLLKGDVLKEISRQNVQTLTHSQVVDILKEFPVGSEVSVLVLRGGELIDNTFFLQKEMTASNEALDPSDPIPQALPFPPNILRPMSPRLDPSEVYIKSKAMVENKPPNTRDLDVFIKRKQDSGFGFRVLGGEGPEQPVYIGAIVPLGAAEKDGRLRAGDELLCIDGVQVKGKSHKQVLELMTNAARSGHVLLTVRRQVFYTDKTSDEERNVTPDPLLNGSPKMPHIEVPSRLQGEPYEVVLQKKESEGFGFVILTSKNKPPPGVIPHKIGLMGQPQPKNAGGKLKVGDRISAVNGQSIVDLSHNDIVQLIKEAGNAVTLAVVPEDEHSGPPSGSSSAKQSPAPQHRAMGQTQTNQRMLEDRSHLETEDKKDDSDERHSWSDCKYIPQTDHGTAWGTEPRHSQSTGSFLVELERASRGFGFSLRGGKEYNMGLFILRLAEEGPALIDGRIHVGDQIVEINGEPTQGITHTRAIELIQAGGNKVQLLLRPGQGLVPDYIHMDPMNVSPASFPKEVTSSEEPPPFSPSFYSTSTPESTPTARQEDASVRDFAIAPAGQLDKPVSGETSPTSTDKKGQDITNNKLAIKTNEKRERSASPRNPDARNQLQVEKKESNVSRSGRSTSPRKANRERSDMNKGRSPSPRKTEKNTAELKDRSVSPKKGERKDYSEATKERKSRTKEQPNVARTRSSSPRKAHKKEHAEENKEMLNSGDDRQRITSSGKADKHGHSKESSDRWEHPTRREDGLKNKTASNTEEKPPVGKRKNHEEKLASPTKAQEQREASEELEKDGKPQRSRSPDRRRKERPVREKANKEAQEPTTLSQKQLGIRDGEVKRQDWEHKKDMGHAGGSENNATSGGRKAPITPGPWKVPSSVKVGAEKQEKHT